MVEMSNFVGYMYIKKVNLNFLVIGSTSNFDWFISAAHDQFPIRVGKFDA